MVRLFPAHRTMRGVVLRSQGASCSTAVQINNIELLVIKGQRVNVSGLVSRSVKRAWCLSEGKTCALIIPCCDDLQCVQLTGDMVSTTGALQWRHNGHGVVSNHQPPDCLLNRLFSADQIKHQSSASLAFVRGIHRWPVNSSHKRPVTRKMFPFDDVIMDLYTRSSYQEQGQVITPHSILWHMITCPCFWYLLYFIQHCNITSWTTRNKKWNIKRIQCHYDDVIMTMLASQITSLTVVYSIVYSSVNQRKHQSSASLAFVRAIHRGPVNFPHKWPVTRKMFPFDDVIMTTFHSRKIICSFHPLDNVLNIKKRPEVNIYLSVMVSIQIENQEIQLEWSHMSIMVSEITGNSTIHSTTLSG